MSEEALPKGQTSISQDDRKLRIFFSIDVSGSTDYKTKYSNSEDFDHHWLDFYDVFFQEVSVKFSNVADEYHQKHPDSFDKPRVWKLLGDEILFTAVVHDVSGAYFLTKSFYRMLCEQDESYFKKYFLRLKGTGWTAGFPLRNREIKTGFLLDDPDFIGPDLDIGFRICKVARPGRMTVSLDLADLLAQANDLDMFSFHHVGWEVFQGVFNNQPYPIFWICGGKAPYILPWEVEKCPLTRKFEAGAEITSEKLRALVQSMRDALPALKLFPPYFPKQTLDHAEEIKKMPDHHQKAWEDWLLRKRLQEGVETLEMGSSEDENIPI